MASAIMVIALAYQRLVVKYILKIAIIPTHLVNAMSVGIVKANKMVSATAEGKGNPVFFVGSATGKDGIGGASFASANITADSAEELPAVQVGDPFQEKNYWKPVWK
jgi:phosphoribosylformylglycinamidine (FGAM) synthase-like enzyme